MLIVSKQPIIICDRSKVKVIEVPIFGGLVEVSFSASLCGIVRVLHILMVDVSMFVG